MGKTVLIVDGHWIVRGVIRFLLGKQTDICVVGDAEDGAVALRLIRKMRPNVVLMELDAPVLNGIEVTRQIVSRYPESRVLILSMQLESQMLLEALGAGAKGFILKSRLSAKELVRAINAVTADGNYFNPPL